ncbi:NAD(P)H-binding protein [Cystobacter fuscus]
MRVFVTGASGHIGSAVVPELLAAGHEVVALARSDSSSAALASAGAEVRRGTLDDLEGLRRPLPPRMASSTSRSSTTWPSPATTRGRRRPISAPSRPSVRRSRAPASRS